MSRRIHAVLVSVLAGPLLVSACGFRSDLDLTPAGGVVVPLKADATTQSIQEDGTSATADSRVVADAVVMPLDAAVSVTDATGSPDAGVLFDSSNFPDASTPQVVDARIPFDGPMPDGVQCNAVRCAVGEICCLSASAAGVTSTCAASCPSSDAGPVVSVGCDGPEDCASNGDVCCVSVALGAGTFPTCNVGNASSSCKRASACAYEFPFSCNAALTSQTCTVASDCSADAPKCCELGDLGINSRFCTDTLVAGFLGSACN